MTDAIDSARKFIDATQDPNEWPLSPTWGHRAHLMAVLDEVERLRAVLPLARALVEHVEMMGDEWGGCLESDQLAAALRAADGG